MKTLELNGDSIGVFVLDDHQKETVRDALVKSAQALIQIPYEYGSQWLDYSLTPVGIESGEMVRGVFQINGLKMPAGLQSQFDFTVSTGTPKHGDIGFFGRGGQVSQIYHAAIIVNDAVIVEVRPLDYEWNNETGEVILRHRERLENSKDFVGYRSHPKLI